MIIGYSVGNDIVHFSLVTCPLKNGILLRKESFALFVTLKANWLLVTLKKSNLDHPMLLEKKKESNGRILLSRIQSSIEDPTVKTYSWYLWFSCLWSSVRISRILEAALAAAARPALPPPLIAPYLVGLCYQEVVKRAMNQELLKRFFCAISTVCYSKWCV